MKKTLKERSRKFTKQLKMPFNSTGKESIDVANNTYRTHEKCIQNVYLSG
jgi:hypothetical protein